MDLEMTEGHNSCTFIPLEHNHGLILVMMHDATPTSNVSQSDYLIQVVDTNLHT